MADAKFYTYIHRKADTGEVFYVGKGKGYRCNDKNNRNKHWNNFYEKHGFVVEIVATFDDEQMAFSHEKELISGYRASGVALANYTDGGEGQSGRSPSAEHRRKLSDALKGKPPSDLQRAANLKRRGVSLSAEHRAKISQSNKGVKNGAAWNKGIPMSQEERLRRGWSAEKKVGATRAAANSAEHRKKISDALKGRPKAPFSDEHRAKMSESRKRYLASARAHKQ